MYSCGSPIFFRLRQKPIMSVMAFFRSIGVCSAMPFHGAAARLMGCLFDAEHTHLLGVEPGQWLMLCLNNSSDHEEEPLHEYCFNVSLYSAMELPRSPPFRRVANGLRWVCQPAANMWRSFAMRRCVKTSSVSSPWGVSSNVISDSGRPGWFQV